MIPVRAVSIACACSGQIKADLIGHSFPEARMRESSVAEVDRNIDTLLPMHWKPLPLAR